MGWWEGEVGWGGGRGKEKYEGRGGREGMCSVMEDGCM